MFKIAHSRDDSGRVLESPDCRGLSLEKLVGCFRSSALRCSVGATLNLTQSNVGHDAARYVAFQSRVRISHPVPLHKSGNGRLVPVLRVGFLAFTVVYHPAS